jgi:hypothetical protein
MPSHVPFGRSFTAAGPCPFAPLAPLLGLDPLQPDNHPSQRILPRPLPLPPLPLLPIWCSVGRPETDSKRACTHAPQRGLRARALAPGGGGCGCHQSAPAFNRGDPGPRPPPRTIPCHYCRCCCRCHYRFGKGWPDRFGACVHDHIHAACVRHGVVPQRAATAGVRGRGRRARRVRRMEALLLELVWLCWELQG